MNFLRRILFNLSVKLGRIKEGTKDPQLDNFLLSHERFSLVCGEIVVNPYIGKYSDSRN